MFGARVAFGRWVAQKLTSLESWPLRVAMLCPVATSHSLAVLSNEPAVARVFPSGLKATLLTCDPHETMARIRGVVRGVGL
jgi:hypothetical protein